MFKAQSLVWNYHRYIFLILDALFLGTSSYCNMLQVKNYLFRAAWGAWCCPLQHCLVHVFVYGDWCVENIPYSRIYGTFVEILNQRWNTHVFQFGSELFSAQSCFPLNYIEDMKQRTFLAWHELKLVTLLESNHYSCSLQCLGLEFQVITQNVLHLPPYLKSEVTGWIWHHLSGGMRWERCSAGSVKPEVSTDLHFRQRPLGSAPQVSGGQLGHWGAHAAFSFTAFLSPIIDGPCCAGQTVWAMG